MKKLLSITAIFAIAILFSGCGQNKNEDSVNTILDESISLFSKNRVCVSEYEDALKSTLYTDGEKLRINSEGMSLMGEKEGAEFFIINDGEWIWTWDSTTKEGTKFPAEAPELDQEYLIDEATDTDAFDGEVELTDTRGKFTYSCSKWSVDNSMFTPPEDVTFVDFSDLFNLDLEF